MFKLTEYISIKELFLFIVIMGGNVCSAMYAMYALDFLVKLLTFILSKKINAVRVLEIISPISVRFLTRLPLFDGTLNLRKMYDE